METIQPRRKNGLHAGGVRAWGMTAVALGIVGRVLIQRKLLGLTGLTGAQLLTLMEDPNAMALVSVALVLEVLACCAVPVFAFLTNEGFRHTGDFRRYLLRALALAVLSEVPYDLAMQGKILDVSSQNPVFGVVLALIVLYFFRYLGENSGKNNVIRVVLTLAAMAWASMLHVAYGGGLVLLTAVLWMLPEQSLWRNLAGPAAAIVCCAGNPFYLASPMSFLILRSYNGEPGEVSVWVRYLAYPAILVAAAGISLALV